MRRGFFYGRIKGRVDKYGFVEGEDWVIQKIVNNPCGGRPTLEYHLSIEMAKELAMDLPPRAQWGRNETQESKKATRLGGLSA
ncbi:antA/AntB antirepressor family protein [Azovibrio restrictus]|uniref:antA/AntB antirepressor family protein n=1 Tax=Azovibrio restrictus TaxID=146938 RepID=UPI0026EEF3BD|nr:antA/AntB antirepressor family protein [Azovibrio restrictus]MDD3481833.1 antA/AntB antirepressor family protein [Azovibrio restrictus]